MPSRVQPGSFYALPQSPQIFKQLLMVAGYEKYFQIVRCFRDEDLRADRQPEFTQIDLEMSFPQQERIFEVVEPLVQRICEVAGYRVAAPFPRLTYAQAMRGYGSDKPDCRVPPMHPVEDLLPDLAAGNLPLRGHPHPRNRRAQPQGARRAESLRPGARPARLRRYPAAWSAITPSQWPRCAGAQAQARNDLLVLAAWAGEPKGHRPEETVYQACGQLRLHCAQKFNDRHKLLDPKNFQFLWVVDFPMFEWDEEENRWNAAHHPFTSVHDEDLEKLTADPARCRAKSYDLVLNGVELGSGSIRIHRRDVQSKVFAALGMSDEEAHTPLRFPAGCARIRRSAARRNRPGAGSPGDDSGRRDLHPRRDPVPQDGARHGPDVRSPGAGAGPAVARAGHRPAQPEAGINAGSAVRD